VSTRRIRPEVVELLAGHDPVRSSFVRQPWRLYHLDGPAFTARESLLANTATIAEVAAARRLALARHNAFAAKRDDMQRAYDLIARVERDGGQAPWAELVARLSPAEQAELAEILSRYPEERAVLEAG
jgi:hypothetical protein